MHRVCETSYYKKYDVYFYSKYASYMYTFIEISNVCTLYMLPFTQKIILS